MRLQLLFVAAISVVSINFLSGCATEPPLPPLRTSAPNTDQQNKIFRAVLAGLKDPDSAKFGQITVIDDGKGACVTVNAKNALGGYNGYQQAFLVNMEVVGWLLNSIMDIGHAQCIDALHHVLNK